jgi:hypothetical protein
MAILADKNKPASLGRSIAHGVRGSVGLNVIAADDLADGAEKIVAAVKQAA